MSILPGKIGKWRRRGAHAPVGSVHGFLSPEERKAIGLTGSHRAAQTKPKAGLLTRAFRRKR